MNENKRPTLSESISWIMPLALASVAVAIWILVRQRRRVYVPEVEERREPEARPTDERIPTVESKTPPEVEAPPEPEPATWQERELTDPTDPVPHLAHSLLEGADGWRLAGASRRGKLHAHHGTYREDAFALDVAGRWHLVAVSDGAGSARLSRVGSHLVVETAVARMKETLTAEPDPSPERLRQALDEVLQAAYAAIQQEAEQRELSVKEFAATLLLLIHGVAEDGHVIASTQVGDGLIAVRYQDGTIEPLAESDSGTYGGETFFLTSRPVEAWLGRSTVRRMEQSPELLVAMSDGVADDFIPYEDHLLGLFGTLDKVVAREEEYRDGDVAQVLLQLIGYDKRGSFDDRTLVMLYREPAQ